jgi:hypothetical protein
MQADRARAQEAARARALAEVGVTRPESILFTAMYYGLTVAPSHLPSVAAREDYNPSGPTVTEEECRVALAACLGKGWLQVIDEAALAKIVAELRDGGVVGPVYGLPDLGGVDFTPAGAELWHRICDLRHSDRRGPPFAYPDMVHCKYTRYFRSEAATLVDLAEMRRQEGIVSVAGPSLIGPWRVQWWRRFPKGCRIEVEERGQWRGTASGVGEVCVLNRSPERSDPRRLRHILDCHNVTVAEWLLLASMENGYGLQSASHLPWAVASSAETFFGVSASEEECRAALEACLRYGWLRVVDQPAVEEVQALLSIDPTFLAVPGEVQSRLGEIDFTPWGAVLYRTIAAECLGPDWEDALSVWKESYREEHHYCEAEESLRGIAEEHVAKGEIVLASRIVPLGPWCVKWWESYPSGYRLELEIGQP